LNEVPARPNKNIETPFFERLTIPPRIEMLGTKVTANFSKLPENAGPAEALDLSLASSTTMSTFGPSPARVRTAPIRSG
jgi:hypothetical protein